LPSKCNLQRYIVVMSGDLEMMYSSFLNNQVPGIWVGLCRLNQVDP
jgi:hypothetical protein